MKIKGKNTLTNELNINHWTLNFRDPKLEEQYREEYFTMSLTPFRISFIIVTFLYALFGLLDIYTAGNYIREFFIVRYLIVVPLLVAVWLLSFVPSFKKFWQFAISLCYVIGGGGIAFMLLRDPKNMFYYGGLFLIFMAGYFFIKLRFINAALPGILVILFYNIAPHFTPSLNHLNTEYLLITNTFFLAANIISLVALYNTKLTERSEFKQRLLLSIQKDKIKSINERLEQKVRERTELLEKRNSILNIEIENRKEIEEKLIIAKQQAEESDRLKSAFLANMSHEIRTPMNGIIGFLDMVAEPEISKDQQEQYIEIVKQSGNRLLQTINDIIEISKIEAGEMSENISTIEVDETFNYLSEFLSIEANAKNISLTFVNRLKKITIQTDTSKLETILLNLINNAIKFTRKGSITVGAELAENQIQFYVKDTGVGIPDDKQKRIFDRFVQADQSLSRGHEGSGLGLSISKAYVQQMGGKIWFETELNKGTTFYFTIPYIPAKKESSNLSRGGVTDSKVPENCEIKALVAEDDIVSFDLIQTLLNDSKIHVVWAKNGKEAVDLARQNNFDIILMDIKMPVMDGIEATHEIRKINSDIPIIAQTAFALSGDKEKALQAGCNHYLSKPINRHELMATILLYTSN